MRKASHYNFHSRTVCLNYWWFKTVLNKPHWLFSDHSVTDLNPPNLCWAIKIKCNIQHIFGKFQRGRNLSRAYQNQIWRSMQYSLRWTGTSHLIGRAQTHASVTSTCRRGRYSTRAVVVPRWANPRPGLVTTRWQSYPASTQTTTRGQCSCCFKTFVKWYKKNGNSD